MDLYNNSTIITVFYGNIDVFNTQIQYLSKFGSTEKHFIWDNTEGTLKHHPYMQKENVIYHSSRNIGDLLAYNSAIFSKKIDTPYFIGMPPDTYPLKSDWLSIYENYLPCDMLGVRGHLGPSIPSKIV